MNKSPPSGGAGGAGRTRPGVEELYDIPIGARPPFYVAFFFSFCRLFGCGTNTLLLFRLVDPSGYPNDLLYCYEFLGATTDNLPPGVLYRVRATYK